LAALLQKLKHSEREAIISYYLGEVPRPELERQPGLSEVQFLRIRASLKRQYSQFQLRLISARWAAGSRLCTAHARRGCQSL
jgi:hypothetical protein